MDLSSIWDAYWFWILYFCATWTAIGTGIGRRHRQAELGFILGLLLGPLGVALIFAFLSKPARAYPSFADTALDPRLAGQDQDPNIRRPSDVDRAGPYVPKQAPGQEDQQRWAQQMQVLANEELERRKRDTT